jgi:hypothetical protein
LGRVKIAGATPPVHRRQAKGFWRVALGNVGAARTAQPPHPRRPVNQGLAGLRFFGVQRPYRRSMRRPRSSIGAGMDGEAGSVWGRKRARRASDGAPSRKGGGPNPHSRVRIGDRLRLLLYRRRLPRSPGPPPRTRLPGPEDPFRGGVRRRVRHFGQLFSRPACGGAARRAFGTRNALCRARVDTGRGARAAAPREAGDARARPDGRRPCQPKSN